MDNASEYEVRAKMVLALKRDGLVNMLRTLRKRDCNGYLTLDYTIEDIEDGSFKGNLDEAIREVVVALSILDTDNEPNS